MEKYTILYVDDELANLRIFKNAFRREFNIITASSAREGMEILENTKVDVIITDQIMPEMTGVEFLEKINSKYPSIPPNRMILSGYAENDDIRKAFNHYNLFKFISKPWQGEKLKQIIFNAIEKGPNHD